MTTVGKRVQPELRTIFLSVSIYFGAVTAAGILWERLQRPLDRLEAATNGWLSPHLILPLATMILILAVVGPQRLRQAETGLSASAIVPACVTLLAAWIVMHAGLLLFAWTQERTVPRLHRPDDPMWLQASCAELIGTALLEESLFRGLLIGELSRLLDHGSGRISTLIACSTSVSLFTLSHLPRLLAEVNVSIGAELLWILQFGVVLTIAYLLTRNVLACVGVHATWNARPFVLDGTEVQVGVAWTIGVIAVAAGYYCLRRRRRAVVLSSPHRSSPP